jgi:hypothetical protein
MARLRYFSPLPKRRPFSCINSKKLLISASENPGNRRQIASRERTVSQKR